MALAGNIVRPGDNFTDWTTFTPGFTNLTVGNGQTSGKYRRTGEFTIELRVSFLFGSTTALTGAVGFALPASLVGEAASLTQIMSAFAWDNSASTGYAGMAKLAGGGGTTFDRAYGPNSTAWLATVPFTWATNDFFVAQGWVEVTT
jgi:hypothetical protein